MRFFSIWVLFIIMAEFNSDIEEIERSFPNMSLVNSDLVDSDLKEIECSS